MFFFFVDGYIYLCQFVYYNNKKVELCLNIFLNMHTFTLVYVKIYFIHSFLCVVGVSR